jgi:lipoprotein-anchoring transpeptidase ErfK/SrfK
MPDRRHSDAWKIRGDAPEDGMEKLTRRAFVAAAFAAGSAPAFGATNPRVDPEVARRYASVPGEAFAIPAIDLSRIGRTFLRTKVPYQTSEAPGTLVVDPDAHFLYRVEEGGMATRYGVGVGKQGFGWSGTATIHDKREWPDWYPPKEMLERQPSLARTMSRLQSGIGMPGGPRNPLGARAMYLWQDNQDTLYRVHGTVEPWSIGHSVSSGCIRMINQDVIDLYGKTAVGTKVVVLESEGERSAPPRGSDDLSDHLDRIFPGYARGSLW